jgi:hypothetical protein
MGISMSSRLSLTRGTRILVMGGAIAGLVLLTAPGQVQAVSAKLYVANNGTDNTDCGPEGKLPCRSIGRAIAHANAGDQIIVGPGLYGDIKRARPWTPAVDSGDEIPVMVEDLQLMSRAANWALININKQVTIVSRDGAGATVIDAGGEFIENYIAVNAVADGVVFGKSGKGFTIRNAAVGVHVNEGVAGVKVQGNIAETCYQGFVVGSPFSSSGPGGGMAEGTMLKGNVAMSSGAGPGFAVSDESALVKGNLAKDNYLSGFLVGVSSSTVVKKNLAVDNLGYGFFVGIMPSTTTGPTFSNNAAIGNTDAGLFVIGTGDVAAVMAVKKNTFFGNGGRPQYPPANCGLVVQTAAGGTQTLTVNADGNYWGSASGPGGDPADNAGGSCSAGLVTLNLTEWATKEIKVKPPVVK